MLVAQAPGKSTYWQQLAGMYGLLERQPDQAKLMHAAYQGGLLASEPDLLNLARLYLVQDAPYPAVKVLETGFQAKSIKENPETLQLYAQALGLAQEYAAQIPVLEKLAKTTGLSKQYVYLGQAQAELGEWEAAVAAYRAALDAKEIEKPGSIRLQLGTALYNARKLSEAGEVFAAASESQEKEVAERSGNWLKFVKLEIQRQEVLRSY